MRIRSRISGSAERPRLCVFRSHKNIYAQLIDDIERKTVLSCSTLNKEVKSKIKCGGNISAAAALGQELGRMVLSKGIKKIAFDRSGYLYHGRLKALAETLRKNGVEF